MPFPSARSRDLNGYIDIRDNPISKIGVYPYSGAQLGLAGPLASRIYRVYRPPEELADPECVASFKLLPFVEDHPAVALGEGGTPAEAHGVEGIIGEQVRFEHPYLLGNLRILSASLQRSIGAGKVELSPGYLCRYELTAGVTPEGEPYDAIQRDIRGNHLALVDEGRTGPDVRVRDHFQITLDAKEIGAMAEETPITDAPGDDPISVAKAAIATLQPLLEASAEVKALLAELMGEPGPTEPPAATDEPQPPVQTALPAPAADEPVTAAALDAALQRAFAPVAQRLAVVEQRMTAMDSALVSGLADRDTLVARLTPFVGAFDSARMTAQQVAEYGAQKLGLTAPKGSERVALDAYLVGRVPDESRRTTVVPTADGKPVDIFETWGTK